MVISNLVAQAQFNAAVEGVTFSKVSSSKKVTKELAYA